MSASLLLPVATCNAATMYYCLSEITACDQLSFSNKLVSRPTAYQYYSTLPHGYVISHLQRDKALIASHCVVRHRFLPITKIARAAGLILWRLVALQSKLAQ